VRSRHLARTIALVAASLAAAGTFSAFGAPGSAKPGATLAAAAATSVHFTAAGDWGQNADTDATLLRSAAASPDLTFALGDLSYGITGQEQSWCDVVTSKVGAGFPFELISGNHESNGLNGNINDFSACLPNQLPGVIGTYGRQWYVDVPRGAPLVRFLMISPGLTFSTGTLTYAVGTPEYQWTSAAIDGARAAGIPWVVAGMHMPCLSLGNYGCAAGTAVTNLLVAKKVDLVLNGHEHLYQRTVQIATSAACPQLVPGTYDASCVSDADDDVARGRGTVFATVGTGGNALRNINTADVERPYFRAFSAANADPSHGVLDVVADATSLSARFLPSTGSYTDAFVIRTPASGNQPPVASIAAPTCTGLTCTFDGTGSHDPDGSVTGYAWSFGDGGTATTATPSDTYAAAGTYVATLTVTDDQGATGSTSTSVTVTVPGTPFVLDSFNRIVSRGFGTADVGGAWTVSPSTAASVDGAVGRLTAPKAGFGMGGYLPDTLSASTDVTLTAALDKAATGSGTYVWLRVRPVPGDGDYRLRLWWQAGGTVRACLVRENAAGTKTTISPVVLLPGTFAPGERLAMRLQVSGASPTTLRGKVWAASAAEPSAWMMQTTDSTAGLQAPGYVGVEAAVTATVTNAPVSVLLDDLRAATP
jgi:hypothetical protein